MYREKRKGRYVIYFLAFMIILLFAGCGKTISDERIVIHKYKGLKAEASKDEVWEALLAECTVTEYPEEEVTVLAEELETQYGYSAYYQDMDGAQLIQKVHGMTAEELAKEQLKKEYAIALIAKEEELQVSEEEYISELQSRAEEAGYEDYKEYEELFEKEEWMAIVLEERVLEFLMDHLK